MMLLFAQFIDRCTNRLGQGLSWLGLGMVIITLTVVLLRYGFDIGAIALQESVIYLHGLLFLLGIPYGIAKDTHVRVDLLYSRFSEQHKQWVNLGGHVLFTLPLAVFIFWTSLPYVQASWGVWEASAEVGGIPAVFALKTLIPICAAYMGLQTLSEVLKILVGLRERS